MDTAIQHIDLIAETFVGLLWPLMIQSSLLITALVLAELLLRHRVRPSLRYWMWMLVLASLVVPVYSLAHRAAEYWPGLESARADNLPLLASENPAFAAAGTAFERFTADAPASNWQTFAFTAWLIGVTAIGFYLAYRVVRVRLLIATARDANGFMQDTMRYCSKCMGVTRKVRFKVSVRVKKPIVWGLFHPVIVIPHDLAPTLGARHLRSVLFHEIAHIKRRDLWANCVQTVLQIVYFFNPLLWLANWMIRRLREQAANEAVMDNMGRQVPWYAETLADVSNLKFRAPVFSLGCVGVEESTEDLKVA